MRKVLTKKQFMGRLQELREEYSWLCRKWRKEKVIDEIEVDGEVIEPYPMYHAMFTDFKKREKYRGYCHNQDKTRETLYRRFTESGENTIDNLIIFVKKWKVEAL